MMNRIRFFLLLAALSGVGACSIFEDQSPENVNFRLSGPTGEVVQAVYSTQFTAGLTEEGVTQVRIFAADTVTQTIPIDTTVNITENQQFYVEILPQSDTIDVAVRVEIDGRQVVSSSGFIFSINPWRYVYQFNQRLTDVVEVVL